MNLEESVHVVALCRAAMPGWTPLDGTAETWHAAALHDLDLPDVEQALLEHVRDDGSWPNPADLRRRALAARRQRAGQARAARLALTAPPEDGLRAMPDTFRDDVAAARAAWRAAHPDSPDRPLAGTVDQLLDDLAVPAAP